MSPRVHAFKQFWLKTDVGRMPKRGRARAHDDGDCLHSDLANDALSRLHTQGSNKSWRSQGAADLDGVLETVRKFVFDLVDFARANGVRSILANLEAIARKGLAISSCYSGTCALELAASIIMDAIIEALSLPPAECVGLVRHAACDCNVASQTVLQRLPDCCRPKHVFDNVFDRLFPEDRTRLLEAESKTLEEGALVKMMYGDGLLTKEGFDRKQALLGQQLVDELSEDLAECEFATLAPCIVCGCPCPISPMPDSMPSGMIWLEGAGTNSFPFSKMNKSKGKWLDKSTLIALVWLHSCRFYSPHTLLHECAPGWDESVAQQILGNKSAGPKCLYSDTPFESVYISYSRVFSPSFLGVPSGGLRKYTSFDLEACASPVPDADFESLFRRNLQFPNEVYCVAGDGVVEAYRSEHLFAYLSASLECYEVKAEKLGLCTHSSGNSTWNGTGAIVNFRQSAAFATISTYQSDAKALAWELLDEPRG